MKGNYETRSWYYEKFPEYTIELSRDPESDDFRSPDYAYVQINCRSSWQILRVRYHQTILMEYTAHYVDETRGIVISPRDSYIKLSKDNTTSMTKHFYYYFENSIEIKLMYLLKKLMHHDNLALDTHLLLIPVFNSSEEKSDVEFLIDNEDFISSIENEIQNIVINYGSGLSEESELIIRQDLAVSKAVKSTLNEYRKMKVYEKTK